MAAGSVKWKIWCQEKNIPLQTVISCSQYSCLCCIPLIANMKQSVHSNNLRPKNVISIKRFLFTTIGLFSFLGPSFLFIERNKTLRLKLPGHFLMFANCLLLVYRLLEKETRNTIKRYIFNLLNVKEHNVSELSDQRRIWKLSQIPFMMDNVLTSTTASSIKTHTNINYINVAPLSHESENEQNFHRTT
jgi:hypothetical protein